MAIHSLLLYLALQGQATDTVRLAPPTDSASIPTGAAPLWRATPPAGQEWQRPTALRLLSSGRFVVADRGTGALLYFDSAGRWRGTFGRPGRGPGEFQGLQDLVVLAGDTVAVRDGIARAITLVGPDGRIVRQFSIARTPFPGGGSETMAAGAGSDLWVGFSEITTLQPRPTSIPFYQRFFRYSLRGDLKPGPPLRCLEGEHFVQEVPYRFGKVAYWRLAYGRSATVLGSPIGFVVGDGTDPTISLYTPDFRLLRVYRFGMSRRPITSQDKAAYASSLLEDVEPEREELMRNLAREMPFPTHMPAYRQFFLDQRGRFWLETYESPDASTAWIVADPGTGKTTRLIVPGRFAPMAATARAVLGVSKDDDDVPSVVAYAIPKASQ